MPLCRLARRLAFAAVTASLAACGGADDFQPREVPMTRIVAFWAITDLDDHYAIRADAEWRNVWQVHGPRTVPATERPAVDFSANMVIGLTRGSGADGCHGLAIRRIVEEERRLDVEYVVATPVQRERLCPLAVVPLTDFVVIPRADKPVAFVQIAE